MYVIIQYGPSPFLVILLYNSLPVSVCSCMLSSLPSRHLTSVGRQIDVRLRRHNDVGFRFDFESLFDVKNSRKQTSF